MYNGFVYTILTGCIKNIATYPTQDVIKNYIINCGYSEEYSQLYSGISTGCIL